MLEKSALFEAPGGDPVAVFLSWFAEAKAKNLPFFDAFALATASADGRPSVRQVLFKGMSPAGKLRFVTNFTSRKGRELEENPQVALVFFWPGLERQVRFEGRAERAPAEDSDLYFASRDRESQLGAWASQQSAPISDRAALEAALVRERSRWQGRAVERPPAWGMVEVLPARIELWQSGPHRLHDRFAYERTAEGWSITRLNP